MNKLYFLALLLSAFSTQARSEFKEGDDIEKVKEKYEEMEKIGPMHEEAISMFKNAEIDAKQRYEESKRDGSSLAKQEEAKQQYLTAQKRLKKSKTIYSEHKAAMNRIAKIIKDVESQKRTWSAEEAQQYLIKNGVTFEEMAASRFKTPEGDAARDKMRRIAKKGGLKISFDVD
jgi:hypothetical protein